MPGSDNLPLAADDWIGACRRMVAAQQELYERTPGIAARTEYGGVGEGGDRSLLIDLEAEKIVFAELAVLHEKGAEFTAISEERGEVAFGDPEAPTRVVIDPIDGSLNARRTLPSFALSVAVASGPSMADVELAYVWDFGAAEEFVAEHGAGALLDGAEMLARGPGYGLELVGLEGTKPARVLPLIEGLVGKAFRVRGVGSLALTLCYVGAGRLDGMLSGRTARSVDVAAAQLIAREAGASLKFGTLQIGDAELGLDARYDIVAGLDEELLGTLLEIQRAAPAELGLSAAGALIDWNLAERVAGTVIGGVGPVGRPAEQSGGRYSAAQVESACAGAIALASDYAGLGTVSEPPLPELIDSREWARNALGTLAEAARPVEERVAAELSFPDPLELWLAGRSEARAAPRQGSRSATRRGGYSASTTWRCSAPSAPAGS